jgi:hypothetical protein
VGFGLVGWERRGRSPPRNSMGHSREIVVVAVVVVVVGAERLGLEGDSGAEEERAVDGAVG